MKNEARGIYDAHVEWSLAEQLAGSRAYKAHGARLQTELASQPLANLRELAVDLGWCSSKSAARSKAPSLLFGIQLKAMLTAQHRRFALEEAKV